MEQRFSQVFGLKVHMAAVRLCSPAASESFMRKRRKNCRFNPFSMLLYGTNEKINSSVSLQVQMCFRCPAFYTPPLIENMQRMSPQRGETAVSGKRSRLAHFFAPCIAQMIVMTHCTLGNDWKMGI